MIDASAAEMGLTEKDMGISETSLTGQKLPYNWPQIIDKEQEAKAYDALYDPGEDRTKPPRNAQINRLKYELATGDKKLRFFPVFHQRDMSGPDDPNIVQYDVLEAKFKESPPQLVLYEGFIDDVNHPLSREDAIKLGEPAFMAYLVQQHNAQLKEGERPVQIDSADRAVNNLPNEERDPAIVKNLAKKLIEFNRVDIVMGSGHAIREREALGQLFGQSEPLPKAA